MMTKAQVKVFEDCLADPKFKGKKFLKNLLWCNTTEPKYKKGDCFKVSDHGHRVYGVPVRNFGSKIVDITSSIQEEEYRYEMDMLIKCNGKEITVKAYKYESELIVRAEDNVTVIGEPKTNCPECLDI